jgi:hypothetical protein
MKSRVMKESPFLLWPTSESQGDNDSDHSIKLSVGAQDKSHDTWNIKGTAHHERF